MLLEFLKRFDLTIGEYFIYKGKRYLVLSNGIFVRNAEGSWDIAKNLMLKMFTGQIHRVKPYIPEIGDEYYVPNVALADLYLVNTFNPYSKLCKFHLEHDLICKTAEEAKKLAMLILERV